MLFRSSRTSRRLSVCQASCHACFSGEVFKLWCLLHSCPVYRGAPRMPLSCGVFREAEKLVAQLPCVQQISWDASGCGVSCLTALSAVDLLRWLRIWYLKGSRPTSSMPQQKEPGRRGLYILHCLKFYSNLCLWSMFYFMNTHFLLTMA